MAKLEKEFTTSEALKLIGGDFAKINDFKNRVQKVVRGLMRGNGATKESREELVKKASEALKGVLHLPDKCKDLVHEGFDPVLVCNEVIEEKSRPILDEIVDFDDDDDEFIEMLRDRSTEMIGAVLEDIEEGFKEGLDDMKVFVKENVSAILKASSTPDKAIYVGFAVPGVEKYIYNAYKRFKEEKQAKILEL